MVTRNLDTRPRLRAVVLVGGPAAPYSRSIRIARALAAEGYSVEIAAIAAAGLPEHEFIARAAPSAVEEPFPDPAPEGEIELRRYRPSGVWAIVGASDAAVGSEPRNEAGQQGLAVSPFRFGGRRAARLLLTPLVLARRWLFWPHAVRGWWSTLERELVPADLYHACGSLTISPALDARARGPRGPSGLPARVIYDAIDDAAESNSALVIPAPLRARNARSEAGWARSADAVVTVNEALADRLQRRWGLKTPPLVVPNLPEPRADDLERTPSDLIRTEAGLPDATRVVLFQGRLGPGLGLDEAAEAVLLVPDAALVLLGFGRGLARSQRRDQDPRFVGRHVTLAARHPDELLDWTASADVALIPLPPRSINQRLSTPNKFWEALAAGTPVVVVHGLDVMERLVVEFDLGVVASSIDPLDLAKAINQVLERLGEDGSDWRARIARVARERFGWPPVAARYRSLARSLVPSDGLANMGGSGSQST